MEQWKDIIGYEGLYLVSNYGRILSLRKYRKNGKSGYYQHTKILRQSISTTGYYKVEFYKNGTRKTIKVHQLVAKHFVANPYRYDIINHIDGNRLNNRWDNLEWCRQVDNINHAIENKLIRAFDIDEESLRYLYIKKNMLPEEIGEIFGISGSPIIRKIKEYGINN